ncbi:hypothetical protein BJ980_001028 [Nocardioides daedukensis]|uniref:N-acetyltransferase domain-containing protein n=1 Tax=Nocardioides daedukensis TaxID=634462 RepID=A0A7Y9RXK0_9ACTN|nr:GNAT family N-acetyltransferase [Nocardioides daedukensis]NYG58105.1 hypothetical protein [Nocardioides daedukensis]
MAIFANPVRVLGSKDLEAFCEFVSREPVVNCFVDYRARTTRLEPRWLGGQVVGIFRDGQLDGAMHIGANLVPIGIRLEDIGLFVEPALRARHTVSTFVGPSPQVEAIWDEVAPQWSPARELRRGQWHMEIAGPPAVPGHPGVRRTEGSDFDSVYPACVAMYTEEVGLSPEYGGGAALYRTRVRQLIARGWQFAIFEGDRTIFKAEVACASPHAAQIQGVYVVPDRRGEGLATSGMAAVVEIVLAEIAPVVSLYVNEHNVSAQKAYLRAGFETTAEFTTIMF